MTSVAAGLEPPGSSTACDSARRLRGLVGLPVMFLRVRRWTGNADSSCKLENPDSLCENGGDFAAGHAEPFSTARLEIALIQV